MSQLRLTNFEKSLLGLITLILIAGFTFFYTDIQRFEWFVKEDSLVEWLTVAGLLCASFVCFARFLSLFRSKGWWFLTVQFILGLLLFVAAGEEISWGQRLLGIESSEYFQKNNAQGETNLHNLVVNGVKINKLVFSTFLSIVLALYLIGLPILFHRNKSFRSFINNSGIAVPRLYQVVGFVIVFGVTAILPHEKNPELLECGAALLFFLVILRPQNRNELTGKVT